ncbi:MAG TPA: cytochrome P450, partial [Rubrobacteraceae bacterium]|nr:cytochrome P450 [Rubrobacteraceae bacterium]
DLLSMLLRFRDEAGTRMTDKQLRDEVITLLLAGHETTALALSWSWYLLSQHPEVEAKLLEELQEVLGDRTPMVEDLPHLPYAEMVIKESMRLYPPAWGVSREAIEACEIGGYRLPAGTQLLIVLWAMHRDPRNFQDPEAFNPARWEGGLAKKVPRYAYLPFGAGPRICIGGSFAITEAILLLATIARDFQLELVPEQRRVIPQPSTTLRPRGGIRMYLRKRHPSAKLALEQKS